MFFIDVERKEGLKRERGKQISIGCLLYAPLLGMDPTSFLVYRAMFQSTDPPGQGYMFLCKYLKCPKRQ